MAVKRSKGSVSAADLPTEGIFLTRVRGRAKHYYIIAADVEQARSILHHYNDTEIAAGHPALFLCPRCLGW